MPDKSSKNTIRKNDENYLSWQQTLTAALVGDQTVRACRYTIGACHSKEQIMNVKVKLM